MLFVFFFRHHVFGAEPILLDPSKKGKVLQLKLVLDYSFNYACLSYDDKNF